MALDFLVTPDVLVPNPDTELLVQRAVEWGRGQDRKLRLADVGTGSGCIAVAVAHYLPAVTVDATDLSPTALEVARLNAQKHAVEGRVGFLEGDLAAPLEGRYDAVLANLPYLRRDAELPAEVRAQPEMALFGGSDLINRLLAELPRLLAPGGIALLEIDPAITGELELEGLAGTRIHKDLGGHERVLEAWI
jgi:release factor glutamine methyltransferase